MDPLESCGSWGGIDRRDKARAALAAVAGAAQASGVSESPEQEEEPEEPAVDGDLEKLLEQFREPEEPPRQRASPVWIISGLLLTVLAGWLALRASGGGVEVGEKAVALTGAMLPGKTSERSPRGEGPVDVVEDYLARCKKGMTAWRPERYLETQGSPHR